MSRCGQFRSEHPPGRLQVCGVRAAYFGGSDCGLSRKELWHRAGLHGTTPKIDTQGRNLCSADIVASYGPTVRFGAAGQEAPMSTAPRLSDYIVAAVIAGWVA